MKTEGGPETIHIWIADMGRAVHGKAAGEEYWMTAPVGAGATRPPEILFAASGLLVKYGMPVDVWAWGIGSMMLVNGGGAPFPCSTMAELAESFLRHLGKPSQSLVTARNWKIREHLPWIREPLPWRPAHDTKGAERAQRLVLMALKLNPKERATAADLEQQTGAVTTELLVDADDPGGLTPE